MVSRIHNLISRVTLPLPFRLSSARRWIHILLLIVLPALVFSNTIYNTYHLDSVYRVKNNVELDRIWPPWRHFIDRRTGSTIPQIAEYRPILPLSYSLNAGLSRLFGIERLVGFHLGNIAIHIGATILLYLFFCELLIHRSRIDLPDMQLMDIGAAAALLFSVHPISGVPVNYIASRDLLLMMAFMTASLLVYIRMRRRGESLGGWCAVLALMTLSLLSKQNAVIAFGLIFMFEIILEKARLTDWRVWARTAAVGFSTVGYFFLRRMAFMDSTGGQPRGFSASFEYTLTMLKAHVFYYLRNFVWPFRMRALADIEGVKTILDPYALIGGAFIAMTLFLAWFLRKRSPLASFSILAYWLLFSITSSFMPFQFVVTDYRQYPSLAFLCLALAIAFFTFRWFRAGIGAVAVLVLYFGISSVITNTVWKTEESFWGQSVRYGGLALAHVNYARSIAGKNPKLAERHYLEALRRRPSHIYANINLSMLYLSMGRKDEGIAIMKRVVELSPKWALAHYWLSRAWQKLGRKAKAVEEIRIAADLDPRNLQYQYETARMLQISGKTAVSASYLNRVETLHPGYRDSLFLLGFAYQSSGKRALAISAYRRFLRANPNHGKARYNLGYALMREGNCKEAISLFEHVLSLYPQMAAAHLHLANCYQVMGDKIAAGKHMAIYRKKSP